MELFQIKYDIIYELKCLKQNTFRARRFLENEAEIVLKNDIFKNREVNVICSLFAANLLIHHMSQEYLRFRINNEEHNISKLDMILFLDEVNRNVEKLIYRMNMIKYVFPSVKEVHQIEGLYTNILTIKKLIQDNDILNLEGLTSELEKLCHTIDTMDVVEKLENDLSSMTAE